MPAAPKPNQPLGTSAEGPALLLVALFHAIVQERREYIPQGWTQHYEFSSSDIYCAYRTVVGLFQKTAPPVARARKSPQQPAASTTSPPAAERTSSLKGCLSSLCGILCSAVYGARVDNLFDLRVIATVLRLLFKTGRIKERSNEVDNRSTRDGDHRPGDTATTLLPITLPSTSSLTALVDVIQMQLLEVDSPASLGLAANAHHSVERVTAMRLLIACRKLSSASLPRLGAASTALSVTAVSSLLDLWFKALKPDLLHALHKNAALSSDDELDYHLAAESPSGNRGNPAASAEALSVSRGNIRGPFSFTSSSSFLECIEDEHKIHGASLSTTTATRGAVDCLVLKETFECNELLEVIDRCLTDIQLVKAETTVCTSSISEDIACLGAGGVPRTWSALWPGPADDGRGPAHYLQTVADIARALKVTYVPRALSGSMCELDDIKLSHFLNPGVLLSALKQQAGDATRSNIECLQLEGVFTTSTQSSKSRRKQIFKDTDQKLIIRVIDLHIQGAIFSTPDDMLIGCSPSSPEYSPLPPLELAWVPNGSVTHNESDDISKPPEPSNSETISRLGDGDMFEDLGDRNSWFIEIPIYDFPLRTKLVCTVRVQSDNPDERILNACAMFVRL